MTPPSPDVDAHIAWVDALYFAAAKEPIPLLRSTRSLITEWSTPFGPNRMMLTSDDEKAEAQLKAVSAMLGEPVAGHVHITLDQDVFTASVSMLKKILLGAENKQEQLRALDAPA